MNTPPRELLANLFTAAVNAAQPEHCIPRFLPEPPKGRTIVIGAGKASAAMAQALSAFNAVFSIPQLEQACRRAQALTTLETDKFAGALCKVLVVRVFYSVGGDG